MGPLCIYSLLFSAVLSDSTGLWTGNRYWAGYHRNHVVTGICFPYLLHPNTTLSIPLSSSAVFFSLHVFHVWCFLHTFVASWPVVEFSTTLCWCQYFSTAAAAADSLVFCWRWSNIEKMQQSHVLTTYNKTTCLKWPLLLF